MSQESEIQQEILMPGHVSGAGLEEVFGVSLPEKAQRAFRTELASIEKAEDEADREAGAIRLR